MKTYLLSLQESGISDLETRLRRHPEELRRCLEMVKAVDCNDAFLRLLEAPDKGSFKTKMPRVIVGQEFSRMAEEGILSVLQGTVLPGHGQDDARQKAMEIQSRIKATAYLSSQDKAVRLQASCGIASFPADADDSEGLLAAADAALFAVKRSGKGTFFNYADIVR